MELLLLALGACTHDVVIILEKSGRSSNPWKSFARANVRRSRHGLDEVGIGSNRFRGQLDDAAVKHAIQLSETSTAPLRPCQETATFRGL